MKSELSLGKGISASSGTEKLKEREKEREKEAKSIVESAERKSEREFVVLTVRLYFFLFFVQGTLTHHSRRNRRHMLLNRVLLRRNG